MLRAGEIAKAAATKRSVIDMLQVPGGSESQQVLLQVRFAEVNRRALRELGVSLFTRETDSGHLGPDHHAAVRGAEFTAWSAPKWTATTAVGELTFSDFLNVFFLNAQVRLGAVIRALQSSGHFQSLAEPNLIAYNGQEASFLAGGEIPVPVVQGTTGAVTVTVQGIRYPPHLHADDRRRHDSAQGDAGGQHTRFRQRCVARRLPDPGADDETRPDGCGAARRSVVRHRGTDGQHVAGRHGGHPVPQQAADHRVPVQVQGGTVRSRPSSWC